jgi:putative membrane-bound dehydrogenase-like protein
VRVAVVGLIVLMVGLTACAESGDRQGRRSTAQAPESFRLSEDFRVELFASEPQLVDPVEIAFDEDGRAYVAEMRDYPTDPAHGKPPRSRIRLLETDAEGKIARSLVFADHLLQVSSVLPWKRGVLAASAPNILFLKDTDGDGKADIRRVLYTGFSLGNPQGRITSLRYGVDNWIYAANNGHDGRIRSPKHPRHPPVQVLGADFRFRPDRGLAEPASGPAQFGMTFDEWGNRFITHNTVHLRHVVLPMDYLLQAPSLNVRAVAQDISDHGRRMFQLTRPQRWRVELMRLRQRRHQKERRRPGEFAVAGYFTAATGSTVYNGDVFPSEYRGSVFTADVSGNLVHRDILRPKGVTFSASRARKGVEFLASTDQWFRPTGLSNAPDGNLYMTDMHRQFIETPEVVPKSFRKRMNFRSGDTLGRVYRIVPNRPLKDRQLKPALGGLSGAELARQLTNTNGWHRITAQRLIVERQDRSSVPALLEIARNGDYPQARLHALWTLEGLGALPSGLVRAALGDRHPRLRENALRLAEPFLSQALVLDDVLARRSDADTRVRFQLALTLGRVLEPPLKPHALDALVRIAVRHRHNKWFQTAVAVSAHDFPRMFLARFRARTGGSVPPRLLRLISSMVAAPR